jgi:hypothetical protein
MTSFHEVRFPDNIAYGATGGPEFATTVVATGEVDDTNVATVLTGDFQRHAFFDVVDAATPPDAAITVAVPAIKRGLFVVRNETAQLVTVEITGQPETSPTVSAGEAGLLICDGVNVTGGAGGQAGTASAAGNNRLGQGMAHLIASNAGHDGDDVVKQVCTRGVDEGFDALEGRFGDMVEMGIIDPLRVVRSALQNGASVAGLILTTNSLVAEEVTPWNKSLMTEFGPLDEGIPQPSPDSSTPQSLGLGPSVG